MSDGCSAADRRLVNACPCAATINARIAAESSGSNFNPYDRCTL